MSHLFTDQSPRRSSLPHLDTVAGTGKSVTFSSAMCFQLQALQALILMRD